VGIIIDILRQVLTLISPQLRQAIRNGLEAWEAVARDTPNRWDDVLIDVLQALFAFED
jgi:hypothetical protein